MGDSIAKALERALSGASDAEAFYKAWAQRADDPQASLLFGELGAAKHGQRQMLEHVTPRDVRRGAAQNELAEIPKSSSLRRSAIATLGAAIAAGLEHEEACARLYAELGDQGGEAGSLFRSYAAEARGHAARLRALREADTGSGARNETSRPGEG